MSSELITIARTFAAQLAGAADALEAADAAEERAKGAERRAADAQAKLADLEAAHALALSQHKAQCDMQSAALEAKIRASEEALTRHKQKHDAILMTAQEKLDLAGAELERLNKQVADMRGQRDTLNAEIAALKARFAESAAKL